MDNSRPEQWSKGAEPPQEKGGALMTASAMAIVDVQHGGPGRFAPNGRQLVLPVEDALASRSGRLLLGS
jgi:hypothetical protein